MVFSDVIETCTPFLKDIAFLNFEILFKHGEIIVFKCQNEYGIFEGHSLKIRPCPLNFCCSSQSLK